MGWLCSEDVPAPKDDNFWFLDEHGGQGNGYFNKEEEDFMLETFGGFLISLDVITHWMPLPGTNQKQGERR